MSALRPGDVVSYIPVGGRHAREGTAFVTESGAVVDTFWQPHGDSQSHRLWDAEIATATVVFNVGEFVALDRYAYTSRVTWETYHPDDRARITMQHGLQEQLYVRRGAVPCLKTQTENARRDVEEAERNALSASAELERMRERLAEAEARVVES